MEFRLPNQRVETNRRHAHPFTFRSEGGIAGTYEFSYSALLADVIFAILAVMVAGYVRRQLSRPQ
jgi:hypothetical protein